MATNYEKLLQEAKEGKRVSTEELAAIRSQLATRNFEGDPYTLIHLIGQLNDRESLPLVQKYLDFESGQPEHDALVRRIALQVIGRMWADPVVFETAARKAFGDSSRYVRAAAATIVGFLGARYPHLKRRSAFTLVKGLERAQEFEDYTLESFYLGILELLEVPPAEWPVIGSAVARTSMRTDLIERAKVLAASES